jgi:hypothetical protein
MSPTRTNPTGQSAAGSVARTGADSPGYKVPLVGLALSARVVETGFWGGLVAAVALGALDPPLALLVGAGVVVSRHRRS